MTKQSTILLLFFLCFAIQAGDPRLGAFEAQDQQAADRPLLNNITGKKQKKDAQKESTPEEQLALIQLALNALAQNKELIEEKQELTEENQEQAERIKKLLEGADACLREENEQHKQDKKDLFWILLGSTTAAGVAGAALPAKASEAIENSKDPNGVLRTRIIPDFIDELLREQELNKTIAQTTACGVHLEVNTQQLIRALYHTINSSSPKILNNLAQMDDNVQGLSKEEFSRLLLRNISTILLHQGIQLTDDKVLLKSPGNKAIILRKGQLKEAVCEVSANMINDIYAKGSIAAPGELCSQCATHVGTHVLYNFLVQSVHYLTEKTNTKINAVNLFLPKDCQPKDSFSAYTKMLIRGWGLPIAAGVAKTVAIWAIKSWIHIPML